MTPVAQVDVIGGRQTFEMNAIVDTGFDGHLCVPTRLAVQAGLELIGEQQVELADGTLKSQLVFAGSARLFGETREVQIMLTDSDDGLSGTGLLEQFRVSIEFPGARIKSRSRPEKRRRRS